MLVIDLLLPDLRISDLSQVSLLVVIGEHKSLLLGRALLDELLLLLGWVIIMHHLI